MFAALAVPNFRRYVGGQALSLIGTWVETVAQALLVLRLTHSGTILGLTTAARFAPVLALSPYAGLLVDRFPKRRILLITQAGLGLVSLALGVLVLTGHIDIWGVVVLALAFGTLSAVDNPARQAFVSELAGGPLVRDAVTLNSTSVNVARVLGPTVAAALVATVGLGWCFVANAGSFLFVIASLVFLNTRQLHPVRPAPRLPGQVRQGLRYAAGIPAIARPLLMMMALVGTFTFEFEVSLPLLAEKTFHGNATTYSLKAAELASHGPEDSRPQPQRGAMARQGRSGKREGRPWGAGGLPYCCASPSRCTAGLRRASWAGPTRGRGASCRSGRRSGRRR